MSSTDSTATVEMTYGDVVSRLKLDYIEQTGRQIRGVLDDGHSVALSYQPGDMTAYDLLFTPLGAVVQLDGLGFVPRWAGLSTAGRVVITKMNATPSDFTLCLELLGPGAHSYPVEEIAFGVAGNLATAAALKALFNVIAGLAAGEPS